jgi:LPS O-antigen subunit length determinant protein (WzzB/FepE family)
MKHHLLEYAEDKGEIWRCIDQTDEWRLKELYTEQVDKVLRRYMAQLEEIFNFHMENKVRKEMKCKKNKIENGK